MNTQARVVIIGGGIMGASLLYHLAELGWTDCMLIEKDELTSGSTWHAAGQCPSITGSFNLAKIHAYSNDLYPRLEGLTGQYVSWHKSGGIRFATNQRELDWFKYIHGFSKIIGFGMEIITPDEIRRINPFVTTEGVIAGAYTTGDGHADPSGLCNAMAIGAKNLGASIVRRNRVTGLTQLPSGEWDVATEQGTVRAEIVVNAAGCYARQVAQMAGIDIPVTNMEHHYIVTDPIPAFMERDEEIPVMRCPHVSGYFRQEQKSGLIGIYENIGLAEAQGPARMGIDQRAVHR
jgi:dimethylglycine dehydrogenase